MFLLLTSIILHIVPATMHSPRGTDVRYACPPRSAPCPRRRQARTAARRRAVRRRIPRRLSLAVGRARARGARPARHDAEDLGARFGRLRTLSRAARGGPGQYLDRAAAPGGPGDEPAAGRTRARGRRAADRVDA